jgi:DNA-binding transcriptional MerR regulator
MKEQLRRDKLVKELKEDLKDELYMLINDFIDENYVDLSYRDDPYFKDKLKEIKNRYIEALESIEEDSEAKSDLIDYLKKQGFNKKEIKDRLKYIDKLKKTGLSVEKIDQSLTEELDLEEKLDDFEDEEEIEPRSKEIIKEVAGLIQDEVWKDYYRLLENEFENEYGSYIEALEGAIETETETQFLTKDNVREIFEQITDSELDSSLKELLEDSEVIRLMFRGYDLYDISESPQELARWELDPKLSRYARALDLSVEDHTPEFLDALEASIELGLDVKAIYSLLSDTNDEDMEEDLYDFISSLVYEKGIKERIQELRNRFLSDDEIIQYLYNEQREQEEDLEE